MGDKMPETEPDDVQQAAAAASATSQGESDKSVVPTKTIYFTIGGVNEQAEIRLDEDSNDIKDLFRAAAEAGPHDILKLYNQNGSIINISTSIKENTPDTRYRLDVVARILPGAAAKEMGEDVAELEKRIRDLEKKVVVDDADASEELNKLKDSVKEMKSNFFSVNYLSWLGLFKDISNSSNVNKDYWTKKISPEDAEESNKLVYEKFLNISEIQVTEELRDYLKKVAFNNWQWDDSEMLLLMRQMFFDLNLVTKFKIDTSCLNMWLHEVYKHYNHVPFHNFKHSFMVSQMMYGLIWLIGLQSILDDEEILILLVAAICHDLDHPGYNNMYQVNAKTDLALRYNDISPLENHHCAIAFRILENPECNILKNLSSDTFKYVREGIIQCILATDMARHSEILNTFKYVIPEFDIKNIEHKIILRKVLVKISDISNEARPMEVAEPWINCLFMEYARQSDAEKREGLPVAPFMDREKVSKSSSQIGFIKFVLLPLFEALGTLYPVIADDLIQPVKDALEYYINLQRTIEEQKQKTEKT